LKDVIDEFMIEIVSVGDKKRFEVVFGFEGF
jgi:hypothetical protein